MRRDRAWTATWTRAVARFCSVGLYAGCAASSAPLSPNAISAEAPLDAGDLVPDGPLEGEAHAVAELPDDAEPPEGPLGKTAAHASSTEMTEQISDEPPYAPGTRRRPEGAVATSDDDEIIARWNRGGLGDAALPTGPESKAFHPAPRIKVDVLKVRGRIKEAEVLRLARSKGYWPFRLCYEDGLRRQQKLHGTVRLRVTVGASGAVRGIQKVTAELDDRAVVTCVQRAAKGLVLPRPERGAPVVTFEVSLWPGDVPINSTSGATAKPHADLDRTAVVAALRSHFDEMRACYAAGIARHSGLWGRMALRLRITPSRAFADITEVESRFPDPEVTRCVSQAVALVEAPPVSQETIIVYPLRFGSSPDARDSGT